MPRGQAFQSPSVRESPRKRKRTNYNLDGDGTELATPDGKPTPATKFEDEIDGPQGPNVRILNHKKASTERNSAKATKERNPTKDISKTVEADVTANGELEHTKEKTKVTNTTYTKVEGEEKSKRRRKTKEEKEAEAMPLAARTTGLKMFVGAHVSIAKGLENAVTNALHIGGNAFALFLKSQRKWENPPLKEENRDAFKKYCGDHAFDAASCIVPHGSYLVNLATPDKDKAKQSYDAFLDDLRRCEQLGIKYYNFHPGATNQEPLDEAIGRLAANLNRALSETQTVVPLLENMAGGGSVIGSRFTDLRDTIALIKPEFKSRIGICIDTCHTFAAGYDLRTPDAYEKTLKQLDEVVGLKYLKAIHLNDSKAPFGSKRDLHQNIGTGFLGLRAFHNLMNDKRLEFIPLILETPCERPDPENSKKMTDDKRVWAREIKLLESLIGMDPESDEFRKLEADLSKEGEADRKKMQASIDAKAAKAAKKDAKERERGQKSVADMFGKKGSRKRKEGPSSGSSAEEDED